MATYRGVKHFMEKWKKYCYEHSIDLMVFAYLIYNLLINRAHSIYGYINGCYVIDYSYGFGSRLVIGSLMHLLFGDVVGASQAYAFVLVSLVVLSALLAMVAGTVYRKATDKNVRTAIVFLVVFYLFSPASPEYLWTAENYGRLDTYLYIDTLLIVLIALKIKNENIRYGLYLLIGLLAIATHQIYIFLFFPALFVILVYDLWNKKFSRKNIILFLGIIVILCAAFLYMQLFSGVYYTDLDSLMAELNRHADFQVDPGTMETEYFWGFKDHIIRNMLPEVSHHLKYGFILMSMLIPVWGTYIWIWYHTHKSAEDRVEKWKYRLMMLSILAYVPVFAFMTDWGRWFAAMFSVCLINVLVLAGKQDKGMTNALSKLGQNISKYLPVFCMFALYISTFEKFEGLNFPEQATLFYYQMYDIKMWFLELF